MVKTNKVTSQGYLIKEATANGISPFVNLSQYNILNFKIITTGSTGGTTLLIETSNDNINWLTVDTTLLEDDDNHEYISIDMGRQFYRTTIQNYTGGSISVKYFTSD